MRRSPQEASPLAGVPDSGREGPLPPKPGGALGPPPSRTHLRVLRVSS